MPFWCISDLHLNGKKKTLTMKLQTDFKVFLKFYVHSFFENTLKICNQKFFHFSKHAPEKKNRLVCVNKRDKKINTGAL